MVGPENLLPQPKRSERQWFGFRVLLLTHQCVDDGNDDLGDVEMIGAERALENRKRALGERLGLCVGPLTGVENRQIVQRTRHIRMVRLRELPRGRATRLICPAPSRADVARGRRRSLNCRGRP